MQNVGIGDVLFILLILGVVHGIMYWVTSLRKRSEESKQMSDPD